MEIFMLFETFIAPTSIITQLSSTTQQEVLAELIDEAVRLGLIQNGMRKGVLSALVERESISTTGIGKGIAIPHAKYQGINNVVGLLARSRTGVNFNALDGADVHLFFLILSDQNDVSQHLEALSYVSKRLRNEMFRRFLVRARDAHEIYELLLEEDKKQG